MHGPLHGRRAFVLGGTGGIGLALAHALGERGAGLDIHGATPEKAAAALDGLRSKGCEAAATHGAIDSLSAADFLYEKANDADILACAFGPFLQKPLHETSSQEWLRMTTLNLALPGALASAALAGMIQRGWGRIVFFGGTRTDAIRGFRANAAYAAAKTGLSSLAKSIAAAYAREGIAALTVCPGFVDTEYLSESLREELRLKTPRGRLISPADLGRFVAELLTDDAALWNGTTITADEGLFSW